MRHSWRVALRGSFRLLMQVTFAVAVAGLAFMLLVKLFLAVHLKALQ